jgi:hypothetical protein
MCNKKILFIAVLFLFIFGKVNSQQGNFLYLHQNDAFQFLDDYLIRCFHNLCCIVNIEISNLLTIKIIFVNMSVLKKYHPYENFKC